MQIRKQQCKEKIIIFTYRKNKQVCSVYGLQLVGKDLLVGTQKNYLYLQKKRVLAVLWTQKKITQVPTRSCFSREYEIVMQRSEIPQNSGALPTPPRAMRHSPQLIFQLSSGIGWRQMIMEDFGTLKTGTYLIRSKYNTSHSLNLAVKRMTSKVSRYSNTYCITIPTYLFPIYA